MFSISRDARVVMWTIASLVTAQTKSPTQVSFKVYKSERILLFLQHSQPHISASQALLTSLTIMAAFGESYTPNFGRIGLKLTALPQIPTAITFATSTIIFNKAATPISSSGPFNRRVSHTKLHITLTSSVRHAIDPLAAA